VLTFAQNFNRQQYLAENAKGRPLVCHALSRFKYARYFRSPSVYASNLINLANRTWYRVGDVDEEISGTLVACGNYILSTGWNDDTNDFKICVFDTQSLNWTKHKLEINSGTFIPGEKQSMCVHKHRLILFGAQTSNQSQTNAMYSVDLSPLLGVKSLAMISALAVVANPDKVAAEDVENLPEDLKTRMGFSNKKE
jgi:hypothetical protein